MDKQEIISEVRRLLEGRLTGTLGNIMQEPYLGNFFRLFKESYPSLSGDSLLVAVQDQWLGRDGEDDKRLTEVLARLATAWSDWTYAWENYDPEVARSS